jgi:Zn-dependent protease/CBS domain-containing protein
MRIFGIRIGVDWSWFLALFLFIYWLTDYYQAALPNSDDGTAFALATISTLLFFLSILLHELGHAVVAIRNGIAIAGIDLWLFGGVAKMSQETQSPGVEFRVAAAGPAVTVVIAIFCTLLGMAAAGGPEEFWNAMAFDAEGSAGGFVAMMSYLTSINVLLLLFNLIPAFPLDGGRIARAVAWRVTGDRNRATRFAARIGIAFGWALMALGLVLIVVDGQRAAFDAVWFIALGWLLAQGARGAIAQAAFSDRLAGITVADIMDAEPVTIPAGLPIERAYDDFFRRYQGWEWFAVVDEDGRYAGLAHRAAVEHAALEEHGALTVRDVAALEAAEGQVPADTPLEQLLASEPLRRLGALMAVDRDGRLRGVVTFEQVSRALRTRLAPT